MKNDERQRRTLKLWVRLSLALIISLGILLPVAKIYINTTKNKIENKQLKYSSTINKNVDYQVNLYDNSFLDKNEMGKGEVYLSELVKNIKFNFIYTYSGTNKTKISYKYDIKAQLYGESINNTTGNNEKIWEKNYVLLEEKSDKTNNSTGFNITENINLDFIKYKEEVQEFKKRFGINLNTKLIITMNLKLNGNYNEDKIKKNDSIKIEIPLGVQAFSIKENYKKQNTNNIYIKVPEKNNISNVIYITIFIISSLLFILLYKIIFNIKPKSYYTKTLNKILKTYGQIIVEVNTPIKEKNLNIVLVKNFEELIDLEEELRIPIILYENIYNYTAIFTITYNNTIYKYILKNKKET